MKREPSPSVVNVLNTKANIQSLVYFILVYLHCTCDHFNTFTIHCI